MSDSSTNLDYIVSTQSQKEVTANAYFDASSPASFGGRRGPSTTALTWGIYGGKAFKAGAITMIANATVALTASVTNYVEYDPVVGSFSANTTGFTAGRVPLYSIVAGTVSVTSYTDERFWGCPANPRQAISVAGSANVTLTQAQASSEILEFTGAIGANIQTIVPLNPQQWTIFNNTTGAFTVTIIGASGTGIVVAQGKRAILYSDGTNVVRVTPDT